MERTTSCSIGLSSILIFFTLFGWMQELSSLIIVFTITIKRDTFIPPPVLPAQAPTNIKDNQNSLRKYRPHIEICGSISSSRNDGSHLESSLLESSSKACEHFSCINSDSYNGQANNPQIVTYLFILGCCITFFVRSR